MNHAENKKISDRSRSRGKNEVRTRLSSLADCFEGFEQSLQKKKQRNKTDQEKRITDLKTDLVKLDQEIKIESKRRKETVNALETLFSDNLAQSKREVDETMTSKIDKILLKVADLNKNIDKIAISIDDSTQDFPKLVDQKSSELTQQIAEFKAKFEADRTTQQDKMTIIEKIIQEQEYRLNHQLQSERVQRSGKYDELSQSIENESRLRKKTGERLQQYLKEQTTQLAAEISSCHENREETMDQLTNAFVHYTSALQDSVKILADTS